MPSLAPTAEMTKFAAKLGGVMVRDASLPFGRLLGADPAFAFARRLLDDFEGVRNAERLTFRSDLQLIDNGNPWVVSGIANGRFCIGVSAGYTARVAEVSAAAIHISFMGIESARRAIPELGSIGSLFLHETSSGSGGPGAFDALIRPLHKTGHSQKQVYLSNLLLTHSLVREIRIVVDGHLLYGAHGGELTAQSRARLQSFAALDVDSDAFGFVLMNLLQGLPFFDVPAKGFPVFERLRAFLLGVMLLSLVEGDLPAPSGVSVDSVTSADRIINFSNLLVRVGTAMPGSWDDLEELHRDLNSVLRSLAEAEPHFAPLASPMVREEVARHERKAEGLMTSPEIRRAKATMPQLAFAPKNMAAG